MVPLSSTGRLLFSVKHHLMANSPSERQSNELISVSSIQCLKMVILFTQKKLTILRHCEGREWSSHTGQVLD